MRSVRLPRHAGCSQAMAFLAEDLRALLQAAQAAPAEQAGAA